MPRGENDFIVQLESTSFSKMLADAQRLDPVTAGAISQIMENGYITHGQCKKFKGMRLRNGILFRQSRMVIPGSMADQVIDIIHSTGSSHWGVQRTFEETRRRCYWRGLFRDVERFCSTCEVCMKSKRANNRRQPLVPIKLRYNFPRAMVSFDIATLPWTSGGYRYVLIMTDLFAKFIEAVPMRNQEAGSVPKALEQGWFLRHGYPLILLSDQGRNVEWRTLRRRTFRPGHFVAWTIRRRTLRRPDNSSTDTSSPGYLVPKGYVKEIYLIMNTNENTLR